MSESFWIVRIVLMVLLLLSALLLIVCILFQQTKSSGLGAIGGGSTETYYYKNKGRSLEGILKRATIILSISTLVFAVLFLASWQMAQWRPNADVEASVRSLLSFIR